MSCYAPSQATRRGSLARHIASSQGTRESSRTRLVSLLALAARLPRTPYVAPIPGICKRGHAITAHRCTTCHKAFYRAKRAGLSIDAYLLSQTDTMTT